MAGLRRLRANSRAEARKRLERERLYAEPVQRMLKPCPLCGADFCIAQEPQDNHPVGGMFYIFHDYGPVGSDARKCIINVGRHFSTAEEAAAAWNQRVAWDGGNKESAAPHAEARSLRGQALSKDSTGALSPIRPADDITVRLDNLAQSLAGKCSPDTLVDLAEAASLITMLRRSAGAA
jgi:post-segregation antitoxin (ccd killing protein)